MERKVKVVKARDKQDNTEEKVLLSKQALHDFRRHVNTARDVLKNLDAKLIELTKE